MINFKKNFISILLFVSNKDNLSKKIIILINIFKIIFNYCMRKCSASLCKTSFFIKSFSFSDKFNSSNCLLKKSQSIYFLKILIFFY